MTVTMRPVAAAPPVIRSLSKDTMCSLIEKHGPTVLPRLLDTALRLKSTQQKYTLEKIQLVLHDLLRLFETIEDQEIRVVPGAFNSTPEAVGYFLGAASSWTPLEILSKSKAARRLGTRLDSISSEHSIANIFRIQGWDDGGFGSYVHRFVGNEMAVFNRTGNAEDKNSHFFYVWHPDNDWHTSFEERQAARPLGPNFGGYHYDLSALCLRMRADREAINSVSKDGRNAVFHLVIPAYQPILVNTPFRFDKELFPLIITGTRHQGTDLVWLALYQSLKAGRLEMNAISVWPDEKEEKAADACCEVAAVLLLLLVGYGLCVMWCVDSPFTYVIGGCCLIIAFVIVAYGRIAPDDPVVLGNAQFFGQLH